MTPKKFNPFRLPLSRPWLAHTLESILGLSVLAKYYDATPKLEQNENGSENTAFLAYTLDCVGVTTAIANLERIESIPKEGPIIFVANHPLGGLEGVGMSYELQKFRPDLKVLTNLQLTTIPELSDIFIGVDVLSPNAKKDNAKGVRAACKHLGAGGALLIYPAGEVSSVDTDDYTIKDKSWAPLVGKLINKYQATAMPFFVEGKNSKLFYFLGLIHPRLRTAMLARELTNKRGLNLVFRAGNPEPYEKNKMKDDKALTLHLRQQCDALGKETENKNSE